MQFTTNKGRNVLVGSYAPRELDLRAVCTLRSRRTRVWYSVPHENFDGEVRYVALDRLSPAVPRRYPPEVVPATPFDGSSLGQAPWLFSSCPTADIAELILCRDDSLEYRPVLGMVVRYGSGRRASVGEVRLDLELEEVRVDPDAPLYIHSWRARRQGLCVVDVTHERGPSGRRQHWLNMHKDQMLEWFFTDQCTIVRHGTTGKCYLDVDD
ncbi:hypothetical protein VTK73DRAFT_3620 [Phialemonium thermophilum]|uniref:Uncharacterized protein n=1 Tax=Phialemonium thermophilum TaxID=223376 RepID=A0ABR3VHZ7_9PEZI